MHTKNFHRSQVTWAQQVTIPIMDSKSYREKLKSNSVESIWMMKSLFSFHILLKVFQKEEGKAKLKVNLSQKFI